jgi:hypothetical protein
VLDVTAGKSSATWEPRPQILLAIQEDWRVENPTKGNFLRLQQDSGCEAFRAKASWRLASALRAPEFGAAWQALTGTNGLRASERAVRFNCLPDVADRSLCSFAFSVNGIDRSVL